MSEKRKYYRYDTIPRSLEWMVENDPHWVARRFRFMEERIEELEDGLTRMAKQKTYDELLLEFSIDELDFDDPYDAIVQIARSLLLPEEKPE